MVGPLPAASIWFEIWGSWIRVKKISIFPGKFRKNFDFPGKNWPFRPTATSGQIILFLFKSHHFRTYFLYMIRYNDISRLAQDPNDRLAQNLGVATPQPRSIDAPGLNDGRMDYKRMD